MARQGPDATVRATEALLGRQVVIFITRSTVSTRGGGYLSRCWREQLRRLWTQRRAARQCRAPGGPLWEGQHGAQTLTQRDPPPRRGTRHGTPKPFAQERGASLRPGLPSTPPLSQEVSPTGRLLVQGVGWRHPGRRRKRTSAQSWGEV